MTCFDKKIQPLKNVVIYCYSKEKDNLEIKLELLRDYCKKNKINVIDEIYDVGKPNKLNNKPNLMKLLDEYHNIDLLTLNFDNISKKMDDIFYVNSKLLTNNCRLYNYMRDEFLDVDKNDSILILKSINRYNLEKLKEKEEKKFEI